MFFPVKRMNDNTGCCRVDAVVTVDSKGQIVLPKDLREKAGLKPNDKLAVIGCESEGKMCCYHDDQSRRSREKCESHAWTDVEGDSEVGGDLDERGKSQKDGEKGLC